ncbi:MAG: cache domain-containing protein [Candidatus Riflebacteria bacterium]|nr:cache domain-containing protein [Candidatus Riflebacteria bacterium]
MIISRLKVFIGLMLLLCLFIPTCFSIYFFYQRESEDEKDFHEMLLSDMSRLLEQFENISYKAIKNQHSYYFSSEYRFHEDGKILKYSVKTILNHIEKQFGKKPEAELLQKDFDQIKKDLDGFTLGNNVSGPVIVTQDNSNQILYVNEIPDRDRSLITKEVEKLFLPGRTEPGQFFEANKEKSQSFYYFERHPTKKIAIGLGMEEIPNRETILKKILARIDSMNLKRTFGGFWITDSKGMVIFHNDGSLVGKSSYNLPQLSYIQKGINLATNFGEGSIEFDQLSPISNRSERRIAFVKRFPPLDWIIGLSCDTSIVSKEISWQKSDLLSECGTFAAKIFVSFILIFMVSLKILSVQIRKNPEEAKFLESDFDSENSFDSSSEESKEEDELEADSVKAVLNCLVELNKSYVSEQSKILILREILASSKEAEPKK